MTTSIAFLLIKVTGVLAVAWLCLLPLRRSTASMRHLVCAAALAGSLLVPLLPRIAPAAIPVQVPGSVDFTIVTAAPQASGWPLYRILGVVWCVGTLLLLARTLLGYVSLGRLLRKSSATGTAGGARIVSADIGVPFVSGLLRPTIALPATWPEEFREAAVRHELAHVQRRDLWVELFTRVTCAVYWFHPLIWMTAAQLRSEREAACDDAVLHSGFDAPSYAEALVAAARRTVNLPHLGCTMVNQTTLKARTARLLDSSLPRMSSTSARIRAVIACAIVLGAIGILIPVHAQVPAPAAANLPNTMQAEQSPASVPAAAPAPASNPAQAAAPQSPASEDVYTVGGDVSAPSLASRIEPAYTDEAKEEKISGTVELQLIVSADGTARNIEVVRGLGYGLDQSAIDAVTQWRFNPGQRNGEPVAVRAKIQVNFKLL